MVVPLCALGCSSDGEGGKGSGGAGGSSAGAGGSGGASGGGSGGASGGGAGASGGSAGGTGGSAGTSGGSGGSAGATGGAGGATGGTGGATGTDVCTFEVNGESKDLSTGTLITVVSGNVINMSCSLASTSVSFSIGAADGPGSYPCEDGVVNGITNLGYGISTDQWSSYGQQGTNGSCSITLDVLPTQVGDRLKGTFSGTLKRRAGPPTNPDAVITNGVFDVPRTI